MAASKPTFHMYVISLYHIYHCVFVPMEHYCQLRQMSTRYQAMSQTLPCLYVSEMWYRFDGYLQILSDIILIQYLPLYFRHSRRCITEFEPFLYTSWLYTLAPIPIPFILPNRLTGAPYLALLSNYATHAYLIYLTHIPLLARPRARRPS